MDDFQQTTERFAVEHGTVTHAYLMYFANPNGGEATCIELIDGSYYLSGDIDVVLDWVRQLPTLPVMDSSAPSPSPRAAPADRAEY